MKANTYKENKQLNVSSDEEDITCNHLSAADGNEPLRIKLYKRITERATRYAHAYSPMDPNEWLGNIDYFEFDGNEHEMLGLALREIDLSSIEWVNSENKFCAVQWNIKVTSETRQYCGSALA